MKRDMSVEYRKNTATFHASPPASVSPSRARVTPGSAPQPPFPRQWLVSAGDRRAGRLPRPTRSARRAAGASLVHWGGTRLGRLSWERLHSSGTRGGASMLRGETRVSQIA